MEAIGQLTGGIAHDFNNLLMIVSGHAQKLKNRLADAKDVRAVQAIEMAASRGENLTRQMLAFCAHSAARPDGDRSCRRRPRLCATFSPARCNVNIELVIDVPDEHVAGPRRQIGA